MQEPGIELIQHNGATLALIVRRSVASTATRFFSTNDMNFQLGHVVYAAGTEIPRHYHNPVERTLKGTSEVLVVQQGRCIADFFDDECQLVASAEIGEGDVLLLNGGAHGFRVLQDLRLLEVKQGPYVGPEEKTRF